MSGVIKTLFERWKAEGPAWKCNQCDACHERAENARLREAAGNVADSLELLRDAGGRGLETNIEVLREALKEQT